MQTLALLRPENNLLWHIWHYSFRLPMFKLWLPKFEWYPATRSNIGTVNYGSLNSIQLNNKGHLMPSDAIKKQNFSN